MYNKIDFFFLELYLKNVNYFFFKTNKICKKYSIYDYYINSTNLYKDLNLFLIKKVSLNWFYLSKKIYILRGLVSIFDNIKRSYKIWVVKKRKKLSINLPFFLYAKNSYNKKNKIKNFFNKKNKIKNFFNKKFNLKKINKEKDIKYNLLNFYSKKRNIKKKFIKKFNLIDIFLKKDSKINKDKNFYFKSNKNVMFSKKKLNLVNLII
jgi:hypothetical protein